MTRVVDAKGEPTRRFFDLDRATAGVGIAYSIEVSPDGHKYALSGYKPGAMDVWVLDDRTPEPERMTFGPEEDEQPVWSSDGKSIAYTSALAGTMRRILIKTVASGAAPTEVRRWSQHIHLTSWSRDGRWLLGTVQLSNTAGNEVWAIPVDGSDAVRVARGSAGRFSPDGGWIAYTSASGRQVEVYVVSFPDVSVPRQVSTDGGTMPSWSPDGRFLYYVQKGYLVAQPVHLGAEFTRERTTRLFATPRLTDYEALPGNEFLLRELNTAPPDGPLHLIVNWFEELKAKVPTQK